MVSNRLILGFVPFALGLLFVPVYAQTPLGTAFTYQGQLKQSGSPYGGTANLVFRLYDAQTGGSLLGTQTINSVPVANGLFTAQLNGSGEFGPAAFSGEARWLEVTVNGTPLAPRQSLTAAPYALYAQSVPVPLTLSGTSSTHIIRGENASTAPNAFGVMGVISSTAPGGFSAAVRGQNNGTGGLGIGVWGSQAGSGWGGYFTSVAGRGVYAQATATSGETYGVYAQSASTSGSAVYGLNTFGGTGTTYGVWGQTYSTQGRGVYGFAGGGASSASYGVYGVSDSTSGRGVYGLAAADTGATIGVFGVTTSTSGRGVWGWAGGAAGTIYGVYGEASTAAGGYGVFASGDMGASGTKSFRIDHPDDPANKYLLHYAAESPEVINFYRGTVVLDSAGEAVVELPHYFAKINKTPSYQLTAVGAPMPMLHVAEEIDEAALSAGATAGPGEAAPACSFRIAGGAPGAKVSWRVEAIRNDRWVQQRGAPVEVEKQDLEKGTYQHPELYGQPAEMGINYHAERERPSPAASPEATPD